MSKKQGRELNITETKVRYQEPERGLWYDSHSDMSPTGPQLALWLPSHYISLGGEQQLIVNGKQYDGGIYHYRTKVVDRPSGWLGWLPSAAKEASNVYEITGDPEMVTTYQYLVNEGEAFLEELAEHVSWPDAEALFNEALRMIDVSKHAYQEHVDSLRLTEEQQLPLF